MASVHVESDSRTRSTLLARVRDLQDQEAWREFVDRYAPRIYNWCRGKNLQEADAADVTQGVLGRLVTAMQAFRYDPAQGSFRGWLKTVTNNAVRDFIRGLSRPDRGSGDTHVSQYLQLFQAPEAVSDLQSELEAGAETELLREAEERVRAIIQPETWECYRLTALGGLAAAEAASQLGVPVAKVYVSKSRVLKLLKREVARLGGLSNEQNPDN
jgi:RNA polymerase sigma-70 factor (ECF subfamily)